MGNSNSVTEARIEDGPSVNQEEPKTLAEDSKGDGEESKTLAEDSKRDGEEESKTLTQSSKGDGEKESKTLTQDSKGDGEESKTLAEDSKKDREEESKTLAEDSKRDGEESKTLAEDSKEDREEESKTLIEDSNETKEEEEDECPLCEHIKKGECKEAFIELEKCLDEKKGEESDITRCKEVRLKFKTCMYENLPYYGPFIAAEAKIVAKALNESRVEKEAILACDATAIAKALHIDKDSIFPVQAAAIALAFKELQKEEEEAKGIL